MHRKKLVIIVDRKHLKEYGFFYHEASHCWWNVLRTSKNDKSNVELSLRLYDDNDELRLHATNDHIKLPSLYNPKYDKNNYLELEEELDKFSFDEWTQLGIVFELIKGGIVDYKKYEYKKVQKRINNVIDKLDDKRRKENRVEDGIDRLVDLIVGQKSIDTLEE
jgi:hypothetical protein